MIILNVFFDVKDGHEAAFLRLMNDMVVKSNREDGCILYQLVRFEHSKYDFALIEHWESKAHLVEHGKTPHWINFNDTVNAYLTEHYDEHHYEEIAR
jgi:quinol monooxygenase YgiN